MTDEQRTVVRRALQTWLDEGLALVGLHGDCIGADVDFHNICRELKLDVKKRPSTWDSTVANTDAIQVAEPERPYARNRAIVANCDCMIATPPNYEYIDRSGTWFTLTYAAKTGKRVTVVFPNGTTDIKNRDAK
jgi:Na+-transporting NADH:ubiquinone oxidoreductase subunit NqrF